MLQVTDNAAAVFQDILAHEEVQGSAIRLAAAPSEEPGKGEITFLAVESPEAGDVEVSAAGVQVFMEPQLAGQLDHAVLDAEGTGEGANFSVFPQSPG